MSRAAGAESRTLAFTVGKDLRPFYLFFSSKIRITSRCHGLNPPLHDASCPWNGRYQAEEAETPWEKGKSGFYFGSQWQSWDRGEVKMGVHWLVVDWCWVKSGPWTLSAPLWLTWTDLQLYTVTLKEIWKKWYQMKDWCRLWSDPIHTLCNSPFIHHCQ